MSSFPISISWQVASPPTNIFNQLAQSAKTLDQSLQTTASKMDQFASGVERLESPLSGAASGMGEMASGMGELEGSIGSAASGMGEFAGATEELNGSIGETGGFIQDAAGSMGELSSGATESGSAMSELSGTTGEFNGVIGETGGFVTETGTSMTEMGTAATEGGTAMTELTTATTDTNTALTESVDALGNVVPGLQDTATGATDSAQGFSDLAPPIEDTNAALDTSSGLLEGVSPLLSSTGENAATAATSSDDFTGALSGMNDELPGVTGGLTSSNTLVGTFGDEAATTAGKTDDLKSSVSTLAFGLTTMVGAGYGVVSSFLGIRNAGFKVESANIAVTKSTAAADKALLSVGKAIRKLATDSEAPITGMTNLNTAFARFKSLVDSGVKSGPQFTTALDNLKKAADGLHGSTIKDNEAIAALNILIAQMGGKMAKAELDVRKQQRAQENLQKSFLDAGMGLVTLIGSAGSMVQIFSSGAAAVGVLKGAFVDLAIISSQSVIPAIAGIAVPIGIAVAAIVGFIAAVTAIRANIKVFDDMGVAIGKVFPALKDGLNTARQAFINFSDAINSTVSLFLGGVDAMTGGAFKLQEKWNGFTDTLPQGTANLNVLTGAFAGVNVGMADASKKATAAKGSFEILSSGVLKLADGNIVAADSWIQNVDGTATYLKEAVKVAPATEEIVTAQEELGTTVETTGTTVKKQTANYSDLTNAQKLSVQAMNNVTERLADEREKRGMAILEAQKYLSVIKGINPALFASGAAIVGVSNALAGQEDAHFKAVAAAAQYIVEQKGIAAIIGLTEPQILKLSETLKEEAKAAGKSTEETSKHAQALQKLQDSLTDTNAELAYYADSTNLANRMQLEFNTGVADAKLAIINEQAALAKLTGELSIWNDATSRAALITNAFVRGMLEAVKASQQLTTGMAKTAGAIATLRAELENTGSSSTRFNAGLLEGRKKALEFLLGVQQAKGETVGFRQEVLKAAQAIPGALADMSSQSTEQLQRFIQVVAGVPDAFEDVLSSLDGFAQDVIDELSKAGEEGADAFMENIDALEQELGTKFSTPIVQDLELMVDINKAKQDTQKALGVLANVIAAQQLRPTVDMSAITSAINIVQAQFAGLGSKAQAEFKPLNDSLNQLRNWDPGTGIRGLAPILANIASGAESLGQPMGSLLNAFGQIPDIANASASELQILQQEFAKVGLTLDTTTGQITNDSGQIVGSLGTIGPAATGAASEVDQGLLLMGASGDAARDAWARDMMIMFFAVDQFGKHAQTMAITVSGAYSNMATNVTASLNRLASGFMIIIAAEARIATDSQRMATTVSGSFSNMSTNTIASMNRMASGIIIILSSFTRIISESQRMNSAVSSAMSQMASKTSSFASQFQSSMSRVQSAANSATSRVKALKSAIDSLRSKTITITTVYVTIRRTLYAAKGGAFVTSSPTKVGPVSASEFGQQELITVTPLQQPGRQSVKGISSLLEDQKKSKARRMIGEEREAESEKKETKKVTMRELPIIIQIDGREISRVVNRRIFEESDALT